MEELIQKLIGTLNDFIGEDKQEYFIEISVYSVGYLESADKGVVTNINFGIRKFQDLFYRKDYDLELGPSVTFARAKELAQEIKTKLQEMDFLVDDEVVAFTLPCEIAASE